jgi:hypothetical protein
MVGADEALEADWTAAPNLDDPDVPKMLKPQPQEEWVEVAATTVVDGPTIVDDRLNGPANRAISSSSGATGAIKAARIQGPGRSGLRGSIERRQTPPSTAPNPRRFGGRRRRALVHFAPVLTG